MKKKELLEEVENLEINNCNLCMNEITLEHQIEVLKKENTKLKRLLIDCKYELRGCYTDVGWEDQSLINKIDNLLGVK